MPKALFLLRHGKVEEQYQGVCRGSVDCLLSETGIVQSEGNADYLHAREVGMIVTSGMARTDHLGRYAQEEYGIPHLIDSGFQEMRMGEWEGLTWTQIEKDHFDDWRRFKQDPGRTSIPGGEDPAALLARVTHAWDAVLALEHDKVAIVAHGILNTLILRMICRFDIANLHQQPGCINEISVSSGTYAPVHINAVIENGAVQSPEGRISSSTT